MEDFYCKHFYVHILNGEIKFDCGHNGRTNRERPAMCMGGDINCCPYMYALAERFNKILSQNKMIDAENRALKERMKLQKRINEIDKRFGYQELKED